MKITPYLSFNGNCAAAFDFYKELLKGEITFKMTWGESPAAAEMPPEAASLVMHSTLVMGGVILMGADAIPGTYEQPKGINVSLQVDEVTEGSRIFNELADQGSITIPFRPTFWSKGFGMCVDRFGIPWMISCE